VEASRDVRCRCEPLGAFRSLVAEIRQGKTTPVLKSSRSIAKRIRSRVGTILVRFSQTLLPTTSSASSNRSSTAVPLTLQVPNPILLPVTVRFTGDAGESQAKCRAPRCVPISYRPHVCSYLTLV